MVAPFALRECFMIMYIQPLKNMYTPPAHDLRFKINNPSHTTDHCIDEADSTIAHIAIRVRTPHPRIYLDNIGGARNSRPDAAADGPRAGLLHDAAIAGEWSQPGLSRLVRANANRTACNQVIIAGISAISERVGRETRSNL